ncbi:hypothetical protein ABKA04_009036 [Annulohypoxylon sp. FPYF3050]
MDHPPSQIEGQSPLLKVPTEVLLHISSYLSTADYGSLRSVCRKFEESLFQYFAKEFFTKRQFMFTEFSLQALVDISKSRFGPSLNCLQISLERPYQFNFSHQSANSSNQDLDQALKRNKFCEECISHETLISSGQDVELLTEALRNLPQLQTIGLRDFNSRGRYREGVNAEWRTYGAPTFSKETNSYPQQPRLLQAPAGSQEKDTSYVCHIFLAILRALGKAKEIHQAPGLEVILRGCFLPPQAFNIPRYLVPIVSPVLQDLKTLFLDLGPILFQRLAINNNGTCEGFTYTGYMLVKFLSMTPSLKYLRFGFRNCSTADAKSILQWFAQVPITSSGPPFNTSQNLDSMQERLPKLLAPELPHLKKLDLGFATIELPLLLNVIKRYKSSLRTISMHRVTLANSQHHASCKVNLWSKFFSQIAKLGLKLDAIRISHVRQKYNADLLPVEFKRPNHKKSACKNWSGFDLERASQEFIDSMVIDWPEDDEMGDDEISSEEDIASEDEMDSDLDADDDDDVIS